MEPEARFDVNRALAAWKQELAAEPSLSADDVRELETHLLESLADLKRRGLKDAEAFQIVQRQLGSTQEIASEFAKANPSRVWRDRVFWMALGGLAISIWMAVSFPLSMGIANRWYRPLSSIPGANLLLHLLITLAPLWVVGVFAAKGRLKPWLGKLAWCFRNRPRLAGAAMAAVMVANVPLLWTMVKVLQMGTAGAWLPSFWGGVLHVTIWPLAFAGLAVWLLPAIPQVARETATEVRYANHIWRGRVFWMALAGLLVSAWQALQGSMWTTLFRLGITSDPGPFQKVAIYLHPWISVLPFLLLAVLAVQGRLGGFAARAARAFERRWQLAAAGAFLILLSHGLRLLASYTYFVTLPPNPVQATFPLLNNFLLNALWPASLVVFLVWLAPSIARRHFEPPRENALPDGLEPA